MNNKWIITFAMIFLAIGLANAASWTWVQDTSLVSGLPDVGSYATSSVMYNLTGNGKWIMIAGNGGGTFRGFQWTGSTWLENTSLVSGFPDFGSYTTIDLQIFGGLPSAFIGKSNGYVDGYYWTGSDWAPRSTITAGITTIGSYSAPRLIANHTLNNEPATEWSMILGGGSAVRGYWWDSTSSSWKTVTPVKTETETSTPVCSGNWDGTYSCSNTYDNDWNTYGSTYIFKTAGIGYVSPLSYSMDTSSTRDFSFIESKLGNYATGFMYNSSLIDSCVSCSTSCTVSVDGTIYETTSSGYSKLSCGGTTIAINSWSGATRDSIMFDVALWSGNSANNITATGTYKPSFVKGLNGDSSWYLFAYDGVSLQNKKWVAPFWTGSSYTTGLPSGDYNPSITSNFTGSSKTVLVLGKTDGTFEAYAYEDYPMYSTMQRNNTLPSVGDIVNITVSWQDTYNLSGYYLSTNSTGAWINQPWSSMIGTSNTSSSVVTIPSGDYFYWRVYANDSVNLWNDTGIQYFKINPPKYSSVSSNVSTAKVGDSIKLSSYWTDNIALQGYIFSTNASGSWINDTFVSMIGTGNWSNITKIVPSTIYDYGWKIYANDSINNWNVTSAGIVYVDNPSYMISMTVNNTYMTFSTLFNATWSDDIGLSMYKFYWWIPNEENLSGKENPDSAAYTTYWTNPTNGYDGNWSTSTSQVCEYYGSDCLYETRYQYYNYSYNSWEVPAFFEYKADNCFEVDAERYSEPVNSTLPDGCVNGSLLQIRSQLGKACGLCYSTWPYCGSTGVYMCWNYNTSSWENIDAFKSGFGTFENMGLSATSTIDSSIYEEKVHFINITEINNGTWTSFSGNNYSTYVKTPTGNQSPFIWKFLSNDTINNFASSNYKISYFIDSFPRSSNLRHNNTQVGTIILLQADWNATPETLSNYTFSYLSGCYQEKTNDSTSRDGDCALNYTGVSGVGTYNASLRYLYSNYTKPEGVTSVYWIIHHNDLNRTTSVLVDPTCYSSSRLDTRILSGDYTLGQCWNGSTWMDMFTLSSDWTLSPTCISDSYLYDGNYSTGAAFHTGYQCWATRSSANHEIREEGILWNGTWTNESVITFIGLTNTSSYTYIPSSSNMYFWKFYAEDSSGSQNTTTDRVLLLTDITLPVSSNISVTSTYTNETTKFNVYWTNNELYGYIFSSNYTGSWVNDSLVSMTGTANWSNVSKNVPYSGNFGWRIYAKDRLENWNDTGIQSWTEIQSQNITNCTVITEAGVYNVLNNISQVYPGQLYCINVNTSNVILEGNDYTLDTPGNWSIYSTGTFNNLTINNFTLKSVYRNIQLTNFNKTIIKNSEIFNSLAGIRLEGSINTSGHEIYNNYIYNTSSNAMVIYPVEGISIHDNIINNTSQGINIDGSGTLNSNINIYNNSIANNTNYCIVFYSTTSSNVNVTDNNCTNTPSFIRIGTGSTLSNSVINNNKVVNSTYAIYMAGNFNDSSIYNNNFDNVTTISNDFINFSNVKWNTTYTLGTNIVGGPYLGGNFWGDLETFDTGDDMVGDTSYTVATGQIDYLPLIDNYVNGTLYINPTTTIYKTINSTQNATATLDLRVDNGNHYHTVYTTAVDGLDNITNFQSVIFQTSPLNVTGSTVSVNITVVPNLTIATGVYYGNLSVNDTRLVQVNKTPTQITIDNTGSANIILTPSLSETTMYNTETKTVTFTMNNTGTYNAYDCTTNISSNFVSFTYYAPFENYDVPTGSTRDITVQFISPPAGGYVGNIDVLCTANEDGTGETSDSSSIILDVESSAPSPGGGGGSIIIEQPYEITVTPSVTDHPVFFTGSITGKDTQVTLYYTVLIPEGIPFTSSLNNGISGNLVDYAAVSTDDKTVTVVVTIPHENVPKLIEGNLVVTNSEAINVPITLRIIDLGASFNLSNPIDLNPGPLSPYAVVKSADNQITAIRWWVIIAAGAILSGTLITSFMGNTRRRR